MTRYGRRSFKRSIAAIGVTAGHVLLVLLLLRTTHHSHSSGPGIDNTEPLLLLLLPAPHAKPTDEPQLEVRSRPQVTRRHPANAPVDSSPAPAPISTPDVTTPSKSPPVDWRLAAEDVARSVSGPHDGAAKMGEQPGSAYKKCRPKREFAWNPEPRKAGIAGGLPYVRLGKRCVLGLGFLGCSFGPASEPNSHLLDALHDPNTATGSVPDEDNCDLQAGK